MPATVQSTPPDIASESPADDKHRMQCMEVWGGNAATSRNSRMPGLDIWVYSQPHEQSNVGGDIHYVSSCATGRITRLLLADVSGHGAGVAEVDAVVLEVVRGFETVDEGA